MTTTSYGFGTTFDDLSFDDALRRVSDALASEGFGVLSEIDVGATLKKKLDVDFRPYVILGACNPPLAQKALDAEPDIGLLLPCNVIVEQQEGGRVHVAIADPRAMFQLVENEALTGVADEVHERMRRVLAAMAG